MAGERPDEAARAPPTPTAEIVQRLRAEATALAAGHTAAGPPAAAGGTANTAAEPPAAAVEAAAVPRAAAAAMAGASLTRALSEMSVADISSALAATNRR